MKTTSLRGLAMKPWEVRGILDGRATMFLRPMKDIPPNADGPYEAGMAPGSGPHMNIWAMQLPNKAMKRVRCPFGKVGDRLYVKETWGQATAKVSKRWKRGTVLYRADHGVTCGGPEFDLMRWRSAIHMPREYSRLTLEITDVRVMRCDDLTPDDALKLGFPTANAAFEYPIDWCIEQWNSTAKPEHQWDQNPFCWAVTHQRGEP